MVKTYKIYVGQELRNQCKNRIKQSAIKEYQDRIITAIEINSQLLDKIAEKNNRKTIFPEDVIEMFSYFDNKTVV